MRLAHIAQSTLIVARQQGVKGAMRLSLDRSRELVRTSRALRRGADEKAAYLETLLNNRYEFDELAISAEEIERCDPVLLRHFCLRRFADIAARETARADRLDPLALALLCDALYRTWGYRALSDIAPLVRRGVRGVALVKRVDNMIRRAQIGSGALAAAQEGLDPDAPGTFTDHLLRGDVWNASGRMDWATRAYRRAIEMQSDNPMARLHLGFHLLKRGEIAEGLVCWGLAERIFGHFPLRMPQPVWRGEPLGHGSLAIVFEHGFGDMIQFARYLVPLRRRFPDAKLIGLVPAPIVGLLEASLPGIAFMPGKAAPRTDFHIAVTQLPIVLGGPYYEPRRYLTVPAAPAPEPVRAGSQLRVGVCWRGHPRQYEQSRSIAIEPFSALFAVRGATFVSLLNKVTPAEQARLARLPNVETPPIADFSDLARQIAACDLVVSVDTSIVHLAGALGTPVVLLSRPDACWRWGASGSTSEWYEDVTVVRHPLDLDWPAVLAKARGLIEEAIVDRQQPVSARAAAG